MPDTKVGVSVRSVLPSLTASPFSVASVEMGGGVLAAAVPLTAISTELEDAFQTVIVNNEVSAMSHPVEAPESMLSEFVLCRFARPLVMENTMMYLVDALRVVVLAGVKLCSPGVELSPLRSTTLVPGLSSAVLVWRANAGVPVLASLILTLSP